MLHLKCFIEPIYVNVILKQKKTRNALALFRLGRGHGTKKIPYHFSRIASTNVGVTSKNLLTFSLVVLSFNTFPHWHIIQVRNYGTSTKN